ncbi:MAG: gamma carbonic anhydrase family protein [Pseudomonadota bacterium]
MAIFTLDETIPSIDSTAWTAHDAIVLGNVSLLKETSVWFGAVLRGDNEPITIGDRSNVQDLTVIHTDPGFPVHVGADCTIGHRAILHGCTIGEGSLVGMGAIILNGVSVGSGCLIGAGALITEGKTIPDNSLVIGSPGKVVRTVSAEEREGLIHSAARYVANAARFRSSLKPTA